MALIEELDHHRASPQHLSHAHDLHRRLMATRDLSKKLAAPLTPEDQTVQAMDDASPTKWHLAHTTWFFETFLLEPHMPGYKIFDDSFCYCFNSYYETVGERHPRPKRGLLTRPTSDEVAHYRAHVDDALQSFLSEQNSKLDDEITSIIELGINHEQQHQELLLTDILALFAKSPLKPAYRASATTTQTSRTVTKPNWFDFDGGVFDIGHNGKGFHYDNEGPQHQVLLQPYKLADTLVTNADWLEFIADGGYNKPTLWLSDGWAEVNKQHWQAPGYWQQKDSAWHQMTLQGLLPVDPSAPVSHVSYFEADAFARWASCRLPKESEWEVAAQSVEPRGNTLGSSALRPLPPKDTSNTHPRQMFGDVWEWTQSPYAPYPGYSTVEGAIGEYNGKFMCNQFVLKGASCATPDDHSRITYRNFFYPHQRWQFVGLRLAKDNA